MSKITKAQKEFFAEFARNDLSNYLFPLLASQGITLTAELASSLLDMVNLDKYTEVIATEFLARADFTTIKRIDKIMKSEDFMSVIVASQQVSDAVNDERIKILMAMSPSETEE